MDEKTSDLDIDKIRTLAIIVVDLFDEMMEVEDTFIVLRLVEHYIRKYCSSVNGIINEDKINRGLKMCCDIIDNSPFRK